MLIFRICSVLIKRVYGYTNKYEFTNKLIFRICSVLIKLVYGYTLRQAQCKRIFTDLRICRFFAFVLF